MKKTKIITTIGPKTSSYEDLKNIILAGCDVIRINLSYASRKFCETVISRIRDIEKEIHKPVGILFDTNGPSVRLDEFKEDYILLKQDSIVKMYSYPVLINEEQLCTNYHEVIDNLEIGDVLLLNDDSCELLVKDIDKDFVECTVIKEGMITSKSAIHLKNKQFKLPFIGHEDYDDIIYAIKSNVDFLALSNVRDEQDVLQVIDLIIENGDNHIQVISKIENTLAVENLDEIIKVSDGVMVDRNDLSLEISIEKVPFYQKQVLAKARENEKIGIIATDMIMDMSESSRPERSLVMDIYNAVMDNCDAIVLTGGTTEGMYTEETINTMSKILESAEEDFNYIDNLHDTLRDTKQDITSSIAYSVVDSSIRLRTKAIITNTNSGYTAKKIAYFRPMCPILGLSPNLDTIRSLTITYGVLPRLSDECKTTDAIVKMCLKEGTKIFNLIPQDLVIVTGGFPISNKNTNFMKIEVVE